MAGIYVHIPFCSSRCTYCGFYSTTVLDMRQRYVDALCLEMAHRPAKDIQTVYLGGGTPSQLSGSQLRQLFLYINKVYDVSPEAEVTIEVNPDDVTEAFCRDLTTLPVNRVSMGVQTFSDNRLRFLHRRHTSEQIPQAVNLLHEAGIRNVSIDLMYGFPDETIADWESDIEKALSLCVEHLSAYCLSIEEGTPLHQLLQQGRISESDEELERTMYYLLKDRLQTAGYEHYEISNFARPGFRSRHNQSYWQAVPYVGLGAAAHSYDRHYRSWNVANLNRYIEGIEQAQPAFDLERLNERIRYNDLVTTALRTSDGLDLKALSPFYHSFILRAARPHLANDLLVLDANRLRLSRQALFISDMIMADLMDIESNIKDIE